MKDNFEKIYSRKDGRHEIKYYYGYKYNGTVNYNSVYGNSEKEVLDNYHKLMKNYLAKHDLLITNI